MRYAEGRPTKNRVLPVVFRVPLIFTVLFFGSALAKIVFVHKLSQAFFEAADFSTAYATNPADGMIAGYLSSTLQSVDADAVAASVALKALSDTPLSARAIGTLALTNAVQKPSLSEYLFDAAAARGWRDDRVQIVMAQHAITHGDVIDASRSLDAAARDQGGRGTARTLIDRMTQSPASLRAITDRIALNPPWRTGFFTTDGISREDTKAEASVLLRLVSIGSRVSDTEKYAVITKSGRQLGLSKAYDFWRFIDKPDIVATIFDPHFLKAELASENPIPFVWNLNSPSGISLDVVRNASPPALHVTSDGTAVGMIATQLIKSLPGQHTLDVSARYSTPAAAASFRWGLICWNDNGPTRSLVPSSGGLVGNAHADFEITSDGSCLFQQLSLQGQPASQPVQIEAWIDDVRLH